MSGIDWGSVPSWISAAISLAALGAATWAGASAWRQVKFSADQLRHREAQDKQEQASKVAAWITTRKTKVGRPQVRVNYINFSELPVYRLLVTPVANPAISLLVPVVAPANETRTAQFRKMTEWLHMKGQRQAAKEHYSVLSAGAERFAGVYSQMQSIDAESEGITIEFRDTNNMVWRRDNTGQLTEICSDAVALPSDLYSDTQGKENKSLRTIEIANTNIELAPEGDDGVALN